MRVNARAEAIGAAGELRPRLIVGPQGDIYVSWTQALDAPYAGHIRFSRSLDGGASFSAPITVNHDRAPITHRFDALAVASDGRIYLAWVDKRDLAAAREGGRAYPGAAVYYAVSGDRGASFRSEFKAGEHSCECCRIALAADARGNVAALWRHVFDGGVRDHAIALLTPAGPAAAARRATFGGWQIDACPHHGPALARGGAWGWHLAWYDGAAGREGLYYARMDGEAWVASPPRRIGDSAAQPGHPALLAVGQQVYLAWREFTDTATVVMLMTSTDEGRSWSAPQRLAATAGAADYPQLLAHGEAAYLSWNSADEGYRLLPLAAAEATR